MADRSDVDILFIVADDIADPAVTAVAELLVASAADCPGRGPECSLVTVSQAGRPEPPWPFVAHAAPDSSGMRLYRGSAMAGDPDLLMHYAVCREAGVPLLGPAPRDLIGPIARPVILGYLADELGWGLANAPECYSVLNACRALAYLADGRIVSKLAGGLAAIEHGLGPADLIRRAVDQQQARIRERPPGLAAAEFVRGVIAALSAAAGERPGPGQDERPAGGRRASQPG